MVKRKSGVRAITMLALMMVMLIINAVPAFAATTDKEIGGVTKENDEVIEVTIIEDFIIRVTNPSNEGLKVDMKISYYDDEDNIIYVENLTIDLYGKQSQNINAKDYFDSVRTKKIEVNIEHEYSMFGIILFLFSIVALVMILAYILCYIAAYVT